MTGLATIRVSHPGDGIAEITLDRPAAMNAVSSAMAAELTGVCTELAVAPEVRVVVFSAAGERAFSAGADLKERAGLTDEDLLRQRHAIRGLFGALLALPQPAIAAVHGFALGGGCELALRHGWGVSLEAGLDVEDAAWRTAAASPDRREGIAAFAEKRKPVWPGQWT